MPMSLQHHAARLVPGSCRGNTNNGLDLNSILPVAQSRNRLHRGLDPSVVTMADVLKQAGYVTGMFGKWHLGTQPQFHPQARGF